MTNDEIVERCMAILTSAEQRDVDIIIAQMVDMTAVELAKSCLYFAGLVHGCLDGLALVFDADKTELLRSIALQVAAEHAA